MIGLQDLSEYFEEETAFKRWDVNLHKIKINFSSKHEVLRLLVFKDLGEIHTDLELCERMSNGRTVEGSLVPISLFKITN